ncbi:hypothetical protein [Nitrospina gracilis]|uniref:hypothetical protein n=1 Tax=Nitrospina gracilis TaxID=35801 RepID=UPI001F37D388|nr:hypothetical protein [Nitrospina gracilis]MCF8721066.1 hypothetical protein [Nitrospina gracilis Nb-211]
MVKRGNAESKKKKSVGAHHGHGVQPKESDGKEERRRSQATRPREKEKADELARIWDEDLCE